MSDAILTQQELKKNLKYDIETGIFTRYIASRKCFSEAGSLKKGYIYICVLSKVYAAHRLAWLYVNGEFPTSEIDHINRDKSDNRICNLREASHSDNSLNVGLSRCNTSGYKGVWFRKDCRKWVAESTANGKKVKIGIFNTIDEANVARIGFAKTNHGEFFAAT